MTDTPLSDDFIGQRARRISNLQELRKLGVNCYPAQSKKDISNATAHAEFESRKGNQIVLAGRVMKWRAMGKLIFADIEDATGKMQICIRRDEYPREAPSSKLQAPNNSQVPIANDTSAEAKSDASTAQQSRSNQVLSWSELKYLDLGDFIQVVGTLDKTQAGEITLFASEIVILSKSLRPYPNKMDDKDERYRRRYVDMVLHPAVREVTKRKATFWQTIRNVLVARGFTEIFLPVLEHTTGGADAKPFMTHHNTLDEDLYLRISLELYSKRAIGAGFEKVFSIGPVFRNEGMSDEHANEFNHIEWYWAYADYQDQMKLTREVMIEAAKAVYGKTNFTSRGHSFDLAGEWKQIDYASAIKEKFNVDIFTTSDADIKKILINEGVELDGAALNRQRMIDNLWKLIRKTISGPAFLVNEPAFMSPLAKAKTDDPRLTERFHVVMAGTELANGYSEINDPIYQLEQFRAQESMRESGDDEAQMLDIDFVEMLEYGMPPTTGLGFSERLFWFLEDITAREGAMFPILRNEVDALTKKIYPDIYKSKKTQTQDFGQKIAIVVDDTLPQWQIANAVSHVSAFIGNKLAHSFATGENFVTNDGKTHPRNAQYPVVILKASKQSLSSWIPEVRKSKLLYHGFIKEMIETTNDSKIEKLLANKQDSQIDYLAIGVFGDKEQILSLTKSFGLYGSEAKTTDAVVSTPKAAAITSIGSKRTDQRPYIIFDLDGVFVDSYDATIDGFLQKNNNLHGTTREQVVKDHRDYCTRKPPHTLDAGMTQERKDEVAASLKKLAVYLNHANVHLFQDFVDEVKKLNGTFAVVSSNSSDFVYPLAKKTGISFTHILAWEDSAHKEEKVKHICDDWGVTTNEVVYITDTLADVYELESIMPKQNIFGCAWGFCGAETLAKELSNEQILMKPSDMKIVYQRLTDITVPSSTSSLTRDQAWALVSTHIKNVNLQKHCLAVEAAMQSLARHHHADETLWGIVGLLHDADWEECRETPAQHTLKTIEWLKGMGVHNNELIDAILTHAHHVTGYRVPETPLEWSLYCCDELTGLIVASTLVLPTKKIADLTVESVIKKMGSKSFAAAIDREGIKMCQEKLGIDLNTFVDIVLKGMQKESTALGL